MKKKILLTGGTGFLGIHILDEFLKNNSYIIYCIIRGKSQKDAEERFFSQYEWYFKDNCAKPFEKNIRVLWGDVTKEMLGLDKEMYIELGKSVYQVIHTAAIVKHFGSEKEFESTNVLGTKNIIEFCEKNNIYMLFASSLAVIDYNTRGEENWRYKDESGSDVYVRSKINGENMFTEAVSRGLKGSIARIGALVGRYSDGMFQKNIEENALYARIKTILVSKIMLESLLESNLELLPVDYCARAINIIAKNSYEGIFHLYNYKTITYKEFLEIIKELGYIVEVKDYNDFQDFYEETKKYNLNRELFTGFYFHFRRKKILTGGTYSCEKTLDKLSTNGFEWPNINHLYIKKFLEVIREEDLWRKKF